MIDRWCLARKKEATASLSLLLLIVSLIASTASGENSMDTAQRTLPAYAVALNAETTLNSSACSRELGVFRDAVDIRKLWALKVLDSSGEPKPGFIYGNNYWLGSRVQCFDTANKNPFQIRQESVRNASRFRKAEDEFPPYKLNYFVAHFRHNSTLQYHTRIVTEDVVTLGLCLPASCTADQLSSILKKMFHERTLMIGELYAADFKLENVGDLEDDHTWLINGRMMLVLFILGITLLLMIAATAYDVLVCQKYLRAKRASHDKCEDNTSDDEKLTADIPESVVPVEIKRPSFSGEILKCFSIYTNTKIIFSTKLGADTIGPIHGLRFLGMMWIVVIHTAYFTFDFMDNKPWFSRLSEGFAMQVVSNGSVAVDTFFFLSAFLMAYPYFRPNLKSKMEDKSVSYKAKVVKFFCSILKRFIRLTPAYMMTIGIVEIISAWYNQTSVFPMSERPQEACAKYWWRNLLYIHNLFTHKDMCLLWSWYLSNDMQYYVIGTFVVLLSSIYFYTAVTILVVILFSSTVLTGYISYVNEYVPTIDEQINTMTLLYDPPWTRIGPYIVGIVTAYIFVRLNNKLTLQRVNCAISSLHRDKTKGSRSLMFQRNVVALWLIGSACNLLVIFGIWDKQISVISFAFYVALHRTVWSVGIAWMLIACCNNLGGILNTILTFKGWVPLSRLSYCAYLLNPFIITYVNMHRDSSMHMDLFPTAIIFFGSLVSTYLCSYAYSLMMETPYLLIVKLFTKSRT